MKDQVLVSKHTVVQFKLKKSAVDDTLNRGFEKEKELKVVVSDLVYVRVQ